MDRSMCVSPGQGSLLASSPPAQGSTAPGTVHEWLELGVANGWCSPPTCGMHDGTPFTEDESERFEDGWDPCVPIVRLFDAFDG